MANPPADTSEYGPELVALLFAVSESMRERFARTAARWELTAPQAKALRFLLVAGPSPMRDLALGLRVDPSYVTGIVDGLEQRGLVERRLAPGDRRARHLVLTARGARLTGRLWDEVVADAPVLAALDARQQRQLHELLLRVVAAPVPDGWCPRGPRCH
jgi:DNA-binding MarR family transcriptional regulator